MTLALSWDRTRPKLNELELSLFGRGVGECVVAHIGEDRWLVVDSCLSDDRSRPVAEEYLTTLGVEADRVALIVVSHWHDDHTRGISSLAEKYPTAKVALSAALQSPEAQAILRGSRDPHQHPSGVDELYRLIQVLAGRRKAGDSTSPTFCIADRCILSRDGIAEVTALSPSDHTFLRALEQLKAIAPEQGQPKRRLVSHSANEVSVVLSIRFGDVSALLGSDLEGLRSGSGWAAILSSSGRGSNKAQLYKVAHHGSPNGDHPGIWRDLLHASPVVVLTPFARGSRPLPQQDDIERLRGSAGRVVLAGRASGASKRRQEPSVQRMISRVAGKLRPTEGAVGHVRVRAAWDDPAALTVDVFGNTRCW
jgi:beta-lactamase superfamily II metal-dependent hydrolase